MFPRKLRWFAAGAIALAANLATPSQSQADISIQVQEVDFLGNPIGTAQTFGPTTSSSLTTPSTLTTLSFTISGITSTLGSGPNAASLTTTMNLGFTSNFAANSTDGLEIIVNATNLTNTSPGAPASVTNNAGASNGLIGNSGNISVSSTSMINGVTTSPSLASSGSGIVGGPNTNGNIANLPTPYSILQTIFVYVQPNSTINVASTFGGTASTDVITNAVPVPAPAGLALALIGLPLVGLRQAIRRKSVASAV